MTLFKLFSAVLALVPFLLILLPSPSSFLLPPASCLLPPSSVLRYPTMRASAAIVLLTRIATFFSLQQLVTSLH